MVNPVRMVKMVPKAFKVPPVNEVHKVRKVMLVQLVLMVLKVLLVQWVQLVPLENVVNPVKMVQMVYLADLENKVHAAIQVVPERMVFLAELESKDLSVIRAGWVPLEILGQKVNVVARDLLDPEGIKAQLVFLENKVRKALKDQWGRWVIKVNKVQLVCPVQQVVMVPKVPPVQLVTQVRLVLPDHPLSLMTWLSTMMLLRPNILVLKALTSLTAHASSQLEHASTLLM